MPHPRERSGRPAGTAPGGPLPSPPPLPSPVPAPDHRFHRLVLRRVVVVGALRPPGIVRKPLPEETAGKPRLVPHSLEEGLVGVHLGLHVGLRLRGFPPGPLRGKFPLAAGGAIDAPVPVLRKEHRLPPPLRSPPEALPHRAPGPEQLFHLRRIAIAQGEVGVHPDVVQIVPEGDLLPPVPVGGIGEGPVVDLPDLGDEPPPELRAEARRAVLFGPHRKHLQLQGVRQVGEGQEVAPVPLLEALPPLVGAGHVVPDPPPPGPDMGLHQNPLPPLPGQAHRLPDPLGTLSPHLPVGVEAETAVPREEEGVGDHGNPPRGHTGHRVQRLASDGTSRCHEGDPPDGGVREAEAGGGHRPEGAGGVPFPSRRPPPGIPSRSGSGVLRGHPLPARRRGRHGVPGTGDTPRGHHHHGAPGAEDPQQHQEEDHQPPGTPAPVGHLPTALSFGAPLRHARSTRIIPPGP